MPGFDAIKSDAEGGDPKSEHCDCAGQNPSANITGAKPQPPPTPCDATESYEAKNYPLEKKRYRIEWVMLWVEVLGLFGLSCYCVISQRELDVFDSERQTMTNELNTQHGICPEI
jgi:hypothetical protein